MSGFWDDEFWADEYWGQELDASSQLPQAPGAGVPLYWDPMYWNPAYFDPQFWATFRDRTVPATPDQCPPGYWARYYWGQEYWMGQYWPNPCYHLDFDIQVPGPQEYHGSGRWLEEYERRLREQREKWDELIALREKNRERALRGWRTRRRKGLQLRIYDPLWDLVQTIQEAAGVELDMAKLAAAKCIADAMELAEELECSEDEAVVFALEVIEA